jgi:imidazole glycerol-phosphate synthase subunit HisH
VQVLVVDTGLGNLRSVERAVQAAARERELDAEVVRSADPDQVRRADRIVLPGQGGFRDGARALAGGLGDAIGERVRAGTPYLGICLGLQLLFESSEEAPDVPGLGWFGGRVVRLSGGPGVKIPHMGWNQLELAGGGHRCLEAAGGEGAWVYFVHSYHAVPADPALVKASVRYGDNLVTAAIAKDNLLATQFHPEKSQRAGLALIGEFLVG